MKINLWASPRNMSTAIMYSFAQRADTLVVDEPFYATYLTDSNAMHPGRNEILKSQACTFDEVLAKVIHQKSNKTNLFFKQMSHHVAAYPLDFLLDCKNIILIRDPKEMIISFSKVIEKVKMEDLGLLDSYRIYNFLVKNNQKPIILDSNLLIENPELGLQHLCKSLGIEFEPTMLSWAPGPRVEDGIWAAYWYKNVHQSSGLEARKVEAKELPSKYLDLYHQCLPIYTQIKKLGDNRYQD